MGRYTLNINGEPIERFTNVSLNEIDRFTTSYDSISDILEALDRKDIKGVKNLKISYFVDKMQKQLDVSLDDKEDLKNINDQPSGKIDYTNRVFLRHTNNFCEKIRNDKEFYKFVMKSNLLNLKIKQYIELDCHNNNVFYDNKIKEYLGSYLQFRNVLFLLEEYEWIKIGKDIYDQKSEEVSDKENNPLLEEGFTKEELKKYQTYMDNLPDDDYMRSDDISGYNRR